MHSDFAPVSNLTGAIFAGGVTGTAPLAMDFFIPKMCNCNGAFQKKWKLKALFHVTIMTTETEIPLPMQIERALNSIMLLYEVPEDLRRSKIQKVLSMDYRALGRKILADFKQYISEVNEQNLKNASAE